MTYLSILEKLSILFDMLTSFKATLVFASLMLIVTILYAFKKISKKRYALAMTIMFILLFGIIIISNYKILVDTFDNFTTIFFRNIYFPSIYVYIVLLLLVDIIFIINIISKKIRKPYKITNSIMFVLNNILFAIILDIIAKNKINIFEIASLYASTDLVAVLELNMNLALLWLFSIITIYTTGTICDRIKLKKTAKVVEPVTETIKADNEIEVSVPELEKEYLGGPNIVLENPAMEISDISPKNDNLVKEESENMEIKEIVPEEYVTPNTLVIEEPKSAENISFNNLINGKIPVMYYNTEDNYKDKTEIIDPQKEYENKYQTVNPYSDSKIITPQVVIKKDKIVNDINLPKQSLFENNIIEEKTSKINYNKLEETIDKLDNASKKDNITFADIAKREEDNTKKDISRKYSIDEYKKLAEMLRKLKDHTRYTDISVDEAVAISMISNYSFEDCRKFKELLESNLS